MAGAYPLREAPASRICARSSASRSDSSAVRVAVVTRTAVGLDPEPEERSRGHHPAAREQARHHRRLLGHRHPHVQARGPAGLDPALSQACEQSLAAFAVALAGVRQLPAHRAAAPQVHHQRLQDVADPPGAALLAVLHAGDGVGIPPQQREAQVGPERLGDRGGHRPALAGAQRAVQVPFAEHPEVVVLDPQHPRVAGEHGRELAGALAVEQRPGRVLAAWGHHRRDGSGAQGRLERFGTHPAARPPAPAPGAGRWRAADRTGRHSRGSRPPRGRPGAGSTATPARAPPAPR